MTFLLLLILILLPISAEGADTVIVSVRANGVTRKIVEFALNEGSGTAVADTSGLGNNGAFGGSGNIWGPGKFGYSVFMNGSGWIQFPATNSTDVSVFTIEAYINPTALSTISTLFSTDPSTGGYIYLLTTGVCGLNAGGGFSDHVQNYTGCDNTALPLNIWSHIALTYDGSTLRYYRDGQLINSVIVSYLPLENSGPRIVGSSSFLEGFIGGVDQFQMYNQAILLSNGKGDSCADMSDALASILRDMNCAIGGTPTSVVAWGSNANVVFGANADMTYGK